MKDFVDGNAFNNEQGNRARKLFAAVVLAALDDAIADDKKYGNGPEQIARWARSRDGREVLSCAGIDDFKKGCYVGQEITARMKHKTALRKGIVQVKILGSVDLGTPIIANGKPAGTIYTQSRGRALAYLRFDRIVEQMTANDTKITL